jgi:YHS domain-containing protein/thiol-disulfide isomerase/thioredoxin
MSSRRPVRLLVAIAVTLGLPALGRAETLGVAWRDNLDAAKIEAARTNRLLLLHFWTPSCGPCKVLDQQVLSQPQVGSAVERSYVPVKINADASPALARMFSIDRVPTEVVVTPQGNVVATLQTPNAPDAYVAQLENLARHYQQTTPGVGTPPQAVNSAYASIPQASAAAIPQARPAMVTTAAAQAPQNNPYVGAAPAATQQAYASPASPYGAPAVAAVGQGVSTQGAPQGGAVTGNVAATMPSNAMPRSYRDPAVATPPGAPAVGGAVAATSPVAPPAINSAYAGVGVATASAAAAVTPASQGSAAPYAAAPPQVGQVATAPAQVQPMQPPLPANCPPLGFDGCCPVTLKTQNRWAPGSTSFGAIHRGRTYLFAGDAERQQFLADPDSYSPVFAGLDPVLLLEQRQTVPGTRKYGFKYGNAFYLFSCAETWERFKASPQTYAAGVRQAMAKVDGAAGVGGTIRR